MTLQRASLLLLCVVSGFAAVLGLFFLTQGSFVMGAGLILMTPLTQISFCILSMLLHEIGHLACARLVGLSVIGVEFGTGETIWKGRFLGTNWHIREKPTQGQVNVWKWHQTGLRARLLVLYSGGVAVNATLAYLCALLIWRSPFALLSDIDNGGLFPVFAILFVWNVMLVVGNLWPRQLSSGLSTDGHSIMSLLRNSPESVSPGVSWPMLIDGGDGEKYLSAIAGLLAEPEMPREARNDYLDTFITGVLMLGSTWRLVEAMRFADELSLACPDSLTVKGSVGSVCVELGELDKGEALLQEVYEKDPVALDRGIAAAYLGLAQFRRGRPLEAKTWFSRSREADPNGIVLKRIETLASAPETLGA